MKLGNDDSEYSQF